MKYLIQKTQIYLPLVLVVSLLNGCIAAIPATGGLSVALGVPGVIGAFGGCAANLGMQPAETDSEKKWLKITFYACLIGFALDEKNPGRVSALNELPIDEAVAKTLKVEVSDLENYNNELNQVIRANSAIEAALVEFKTANFNFSNPAMNALAVRNGFSSGTELKSIFEKNALPHESLLGFATANHLSEKTAEIYLKSRFGILSERI